MTQLMEKLIQQPDLALYLERIDAVLSEERQRRAKFLEEITPDQKAEFINGEVFLHSPASARHNRSGGNLFRLLSSFVLRNGLGEVFFEKAMISLSRNDYEPDISFFGARKAALIQPEQLRFPAPDFIVEFLSDSTEERDRGVKFRDYAAHGVGEYWMIDPRTEQLEQYGLAGDRYELRLKSGSGTVGSLALPGFVIPIRAIFDEAENLRALRQLLGD